LIGINGFDRIEDCSSCCSQNCVTRPMKDKYMGEITCKPKTGHCTESIPTRRVVPEEWQVVVGLHHRQKLEPSVTRHNILRFHDHPRYQSMNGEYSKYDYAILELADPIVFKPEAMAVYLPEKEPEFNKDSKFLVSGWGAQSDSAVKASPTPLSLMSVTVPWMSDEDCHAAYEKPKLKVDGSGQTVKYEINEAMICAGTTVGKIDACQGDSGGPMVWLDPATSQVQVIGLVSFGFSCAQPNAPGVYARLTSVMDWIKGVTDDCNAETCAAGHCMTKEKLHRSTLERLKKVTKYRFF